MARASSCVGVLAALALALALCVCGPALGQSSAREVKVTWQSNNVTQAELSLQFGDLYSSLDSLAAQGFAPSIKRSRPIGSQTIEDMLRSENLVAGTFFPREVDLYICHLNPSSCKVTDKTTRWTISPGDTINIPTIQFAPKIKAQTTVKSSGTSVEALVAPLKGCPAVDDQCRKLIVNLNAGDRSVLAQTFGGEMQVPVLTFEANFRLDHPAESGAPATAASAVQVVNRLLVDRARASVPKAVHGPSPPPGKLESATAVSAPATAPPPAASAAPLVFSTPASREALLQAINHPSSLHHEVARESTPTLGLVDSWVYRNHCDIEPRVSFETPEPAKAASSPAAAPSEAAPQCGVMRTATEQDHATHVLGIIASSLSSNVGPGVNPKARLFVVEMDPAQLTDPQYNQTVAGQLDDLQNTEGAPQIFSMSFSYSFPFASEDEKQLDPLGDFVDRTKRSLFIIAAGEHLARGIPLTRNCPLLLACTNSARVLTVSAVSEPAKCDLFGASNVGDGVDVVAPGRDIVSTLARNGVGAMSGTSQATAIVAGAASLLISTDHTLPPEIIRNRLIYTSRPCETLRTYGGLLDIDRALSYQSSYLLLAPKPARPASVAVAKPVYVAGHFINPDLVARFDETNGLPDQPIRLKGLKRMYRYPDGSFDVFFHPGKPTNEKMPIRKMHAVLNRNGLARLGPVPFQVDHGGVLYVDMKNVIDYYGRIDLEVDVDGDGREKAR